MNRSPDVELVLREWLAEDGSAAPDRILDSVAERIAGQPRRRAGRLHWRSPMNPALKYGAAAAAILVAAIVGYNLMTRDGIGGPGAPPTPAPTPTLGALATAKPSASPFPCQNDLPTCAGDFAAGPHAAALFTPAFTFSTPVGWLNSLAEKNLYEINSAGTAYVRVWSKVAISQHTATCDPVAAPGLGNTVQAWVDFVTTHPGMIASKPVPVAMGDGHGQAVDLSVKPGWTKTCPNFPGTSVQFIMLADGSSGTYGAASWIKLRLYVLDIGGETVLVEQYGTDPALQTIVDSMRFTATP